MAKVPEQLVEELKNQLLNEVNEQQFEYFIRRLSGMTQEESLLGAGYSRNSSNVANRIDNRPIIKKLYTQYRDIQTSILITDVAKMDKKDFHGLYSYGLLKLTKKPEWDKDDFKEYRMFLQEIGKLKGFIDGEKKGDTNIFLTGDNKVQFVLQGVERYIYKKEFNRARSALKLLPESEKDNISKFEKMIDKELSKNKK